MVTIVRSIDDVLVRNTPDNQAAQLEECNTLFKKLGFVVAKADDIKELRDTQNMGMIVAKPSAKRQNITYDMRRILGGRIIGAPREDASDLTITTNVRGYWSTWANPTMDGDRRGLMGVETLLIPSFGSYGVKIHIQPTLPEVEGQVQFKTEDGENILVPWEDIVPHVLDHAVARLRDIPVRRGVHFYRYGSPVYPDVVGAFLDVAEKDPASYLALRNTKRGTQATTMMRQLYGGV